MRCHVKPAIVAVFVLTFATYLPGASSAVSGLGKIPAIAQADDGKDAGEVKVAVGPCNPRVQKCE